MSSKNATGSPQEDSELRKQIVKIVYGDTAPTKYLEEVHGNVPDRLLALFTAQRQAVMADLAFAYGQLQGMGVDTRYFDKRYPELKSLTMGSDLAAQHG